MGSVCCVRADVNQLTSPRIYRLFRDSSPCVRLKALKSALLKAEEKIDESTRLISGTADVHPKIVHEHRGASVTCRRYISIREISALFRFFPHRRLVLTCISLHCSHEATANRVRQPHCKTRQI